MMNCELSIIINHCRKQLNQCDIKIQIPAKLLSIKNIRTGKFCSTLAPEYGVSAQRIQQAISGVIPLKDNTELE